MRIAIGIILLLVAITLWYLPGLFFINFWLPRKNKSKQKLVMRDSKNRIIKVSDILKGNGPCYCICVKIEIIGENLVGMFSYLSMRPVNLLNKDLAAWRLRVSHWQGGTVLRDVVGRSRGCKNTFLINFESLKNSKWVKI